MLRPYQTAVGYKSRKTQKAKPLAKEALGKRLLCTHVLYQLPMLVLIKLLEATGILGPRGTCRCGAVPGDEQLRETLRTRDYAGPGGLAIPVQRPYLSWRCGAGCGTAVPVLSSCEVANPYWTLQQNANLLAQWCQMQEPSADTLATGGCVDADTVSSEFLEPLREMVAEEQRIVQDCLQLGGVGVDVEMDEVSFRVQKVSEVGGRRIYVHRFLCTAERDSRRFMLIELPTRLYVAGGRTGPISNEELYQAIFPVGRPCVLLPGTVVHTDSAKAYRNLGWQSSPSTAVPPADLVRQLLRRPSAWRWEKQEEEEEREVAERAEGLYTLAGRKEEWAGRYRHLRLVHTAVVHKKKAGKRRQYVAMRRCQFQAEDAEVLRQGCRVDPFLVGDVSWRKGGTQKVDGYWRMLRMRVANRGWNTSRDELRRMVLVHMWSHTAGPGVELMAHLGGTMKQRRRRQGEEEATARRAWEEACEEEVDDVIPVHVPLPSRRWVEQVWRRRAAVMRGSRDQLKRLEGIRQARRVEDRTQEAQRAARVEGVRRAAGRAVARTAAEVAREERRVIQATAQLAAQSLRWMGRAGQNRVRAEAAQHRLALAERRRGAVVDGGVGEGVGEGGAVGEVVAAPPTPLGLEVPSGEVARVGAGGGLQRRRRRVVEEEGEVGIGVAGAGGPPTRRRRVAPDDDEHVSELDCPRARPHLAACRARRDMREAEMAGLAGEALARAQEAHQQALERDARRVLRYWPSHAAAHGSLH